MAQLDKASRQDVGKVIGSTPLSSTKTKPLSKGVVFCFMYYCYIIYSESRDRYYIGSCENLRKRIEDHNNSRTPSTKSGKPWVLKWHKEFETRALAMAEERRLKQKKSRKYLEYLIGAAE